MRWLVAVTVAALLLIALGSFPAPSRGHGTALTGGEPFPRRSNEPLRDFGSISPRVDAGLSHTTVTTPLRGSTPAVVLVNQSAGLAYDHADASFYVAVPPSSVDVIPYDGGTLPVNATIPVGSDPFGVAVDPVTDQVFVTNTGSDNVSVISGATGAVLASVSVGMAPYGIAYDNHTGEMFVADGGSNNVTVLSGSTLRTVASIPVGSEPLGITYDATDAELFVADHGSAQVSVISDAARAVTRTVTVGMGPYDAEVDPVAGTVFVTNEISDNVSVISAASGSVIATVPVLFGTDLQGLAYDPHDGYVWVGAGHSYAAVIDPGLERVVDYVTTDPSGVVFDPDTNDICVTDTGNVTFACMLFPTAATLVLSFVETGLPTGTPWNVTVAPSFMSPLPPWWGGTLSTTTSSMGFGLTVALYNYTAWPTNGYAATPGSGQLTLSTNTTVDIHYTSAPGPYDVSFSEDGLPTGTTWSVTFGGVHHSSSGATISFSVPSGTYAYRLDEVPGWVQTGHFPIGLIGVNGSAVTVPTFDYEQYLYAVTFHATGLNGSASFSVTINGTTVSGNPTVMFWLANGTYTYRAVPSAGFYPSSGGGIRIDGANATIPLVFVEQFSVTFGETGLPLGTSWNVTVGTATLSTTTSEMLFNLTNGSYAFIVGAVSNYTAAPEWGTLVVAGSGITQGITFLPPAIGNYSLTFSESGLAVGTVWSVSIADENQTVDETLRAVAPSEMTFYLPNGTYSWGILVPAGYSLTSVSTSVTLNGQAMTAPLVTFGNSTSSGHSSGTALPLSWSVVVVAIAAGAVGFGAGTLLAVRRKKRT